MSTKRAAPGKAARSSRTTTKKVDLDAMEEKVLRMRGGVGVPAEKPLGRIGQHDPRLAKKLLEIEQRALAQSGRLDELREEAGLPATRTDSATKEKIISRLAKKGGTPAGKARKRPKK